MKLNITAAAAILLIGTSTMTNADDNVQVVRQLPTAPGGGLYTSNRAPLAPSPLVKLPIGAIKPKGWLLYQLELERDGMTGHLTELSSFCKFDNSAWADPKGKGPNGWEELPYWLKGFGDLGYVLHDEKTMAEARRWIEPVLASQEADGWFGPRSNKVHNDPNARVDFWPNMLMLNALQSYYEYSHDSRVLPFMSKYFRFQLNYKEADFLVDYWSKMRASDNLESVYWLYNRTGEPWLLELAAKIHRRGAPWSTGIIDGHGVNISQGFREPGVYFMQGRKQEFLDRAESNYQKITGEFGQFPGGGIAADENVRTGYGDPRQGCETCSWVELMHSFEMLAKIGGNPVWCDRCEEVAFNSLPAALLANEKGLHYLTGANMVVCDTRNKAPGIQNGGNMLAFSPWDFRCCQHNVSHGWPYFAEELWHATADRGLCATMYAASDVTAKVGPGDGTAVEIAAATDYPFSDTIALKLTTPQAVRFPLYFRVPRWCQQPAVSINGQAVAVDAKPLSFIRIERDWQSGDAVELKLPMAVSVRTWPKNKDSASVDYGPLTFSLKIGEQWKKFGGRAEKFPQWPEFELLPSTPWNYGLVLDEKAPARTFEVVRSTGPLPAQPFTPETAPIEIKAKARKIPAWTLDANGLLNVLQPSPVRSDAPVETVTLIPMGAARLRITSFPVIGSGPGAHDWKPVK